MDVEGMLLSGGDCPGRCLAAPVFREVERPEQVGDTFLRSIFERPLGSWLGWRPALSTPY